MWNDVHLCLPNEAAWLAAALDNNAEVAVDVIGVVQDPQGTPQNGFLVNLRLRGATPLPEALAAYVIAAPEFPERVFADAG